MKRYRLVVERKAIKAQEKLPPKLQQRLQQALDALADDPRPPGCKKLSGEDALYRIRAGDYRVIYEVRDTEVLVLVVRIAPRRDVYR